MKRTLPLITAALAALALAADAADTHGRVLLWEDGPYWAETNVGADNPWDYGLYFWWGDTVGYRRKNDVWVASDGSTSGFSFDFGNAPTLGKEMEDLQSEGWITADGVLASAHDAAQAHWGGSWRMPTLQELDDLRDNCDWTWTSMNGVDGYVVRGRDDYSANSIFLPCAGYGDGTSRTGAGSKSYYWSSVPEDFSEYARPLYFDSILRELDSFSRFYGCSVRPVCVPPAAVTISFDANGGSVSPPSQSCTPGEAYGSLPAATRTGYVFAGWFTEADGGTQVSADSTVPDSAATLYAHWTPDGKHGRVRLWAGGPCWAGTNVGADEPWDYGLYFWWGDTVGYKRENDAWVASDGSISGFSFDFDNTPTYGKDMEDLRHEGWITEDELLAPAHDAAQAHWGGSWRMPTLQELSDLNDNCDWIWTTTNGVDGYVVRGRDDYSSNGIFLPCAGYGYETSLVDAGSQGCCWSSDTEFISEYARPLSFDSVSHDPELSGRTFGYSVRPVCVLPAAVAISFDANGGSVSPPQQSCTPDEAYGPLPAATRTGYVFLGWFTEAGGGTQVTEASIVPDSAATLYAHWTPDGTHNKVQLWKDGPLWAETNVGADEPWESGLYFWWGDAVGYRRENDAWAASDGSASNFSFEEGNAPTCGKGVDDLAIEGWTAEGDVLAPAHDAAQAHWGGLWCMPTHAELADLCDESNCDWTWTTMNGVAGYVVRGRGDYASASIFLPAAGRGDGNDLLVDDDWLDSAMGRYWSSVHDDMDSFDAKCLHFVSDDREATSCGRYYGLPVRPVWHPLIVRVDLSELTDDYTAGDGEVLFGETEYNVTIPAGVRVTFNGVPVTGGGDPAPAFASGGAAVTAKFEKGEGDTWSITAFAELGNDALGKDVADEQIKVYAAETVEGLATAAPMPDGVTVTDRKSAVKVSLEVETPPGDRSRFFRVGFGE